MFKFHIRKLNQDIQDKEEKNLHFNISITIFDLFRKFLQITYELFQPSQLYTLMDM